MNVNKLLENSKRSDVRGYNIYSMGKSRIISSGEAFEIAPKWESAKLGLNGICAIGHHIDKADLVVPNFFVNGRKITLNPVRNYWTPAYMDTYYRSEFLGEYKRSGTLCVRETKCFDENDAFISHLTIFNDDRENVEIEISLLTPFEKISENIYKVEAKILPRGLTKHYELGGFASAKTDRGESFKVTIPANSNVTLKYGFAFSCDSAEAAEKNLNAALLEKDPFKHSEERFNAWFEEYIPALKTENTDMLKVYYYRAFLIKSAVHTPSRVLPESEYSGRAVYESPFGDWFGATIGLPIPLQIEEMRWLKNNDLVRAHIKNWCDIDGTVKDYIQFTPMAVWDYYLLSGDKEVIFEAYEAVRKYTLRKFNGNINDLPKTVGSWITGAEYQPSFYQYTEPQWDWRRDNEGAKTGDFKRTTLHRVDECVMHLANLKACEYMANLLKKDEDAVFFKNYSAAAVEQIKKLCYNDEKKFFFDVDVENAKQCDKAYSYDGFMPMLWSFFGKDYNKVFSELKKGGRFDGGVGITSVGKDCPMYWFDNCITGPTASSKSDPHYYVCCWNGPVWPFALSTVLDALGTALKQDGELTDLFVRLFTEFTELHFDGGDRSVPVICEHYRPTDALCFSPYTEYFHSQWINIFISHWAGIGVDESGEITFAPATTDDFELDCVVIRGEKYRFSQTKKDGIRLCSFSKTLD